MQDKKSLVEEALIQMKQVEEAISENAKGILASTMKEEINQLVKESLSEQDDDEMDIKTDVDIDTDDVDMDTDKTDDVDMDMSSDETDMDSDDTDMGSDETDMEMDIDSDSDETPIDLTGASDEEILKVFKAMGEDDGIIVKKDGSNISLSDNGTDSEYIVRLGESKQKRKINEMDSFSSDKEYDKIIDSIFDNSGKGEENESWKEEEEEDESTMYEIMMDDHRSLDEYSDPEMEEMYDYEVDEQTVPSQNALNAIADLEEEMAMKEPMEGYYNMDEEMAMKEPMEGYYNMDEDDHYSSLEEELYESIKKAKKSIKPKGVGIGRGPKFGYDKKPNMSGGFSEKKKEAFGKGIKAMGTGKAKFTYKDGENVEKGKNTMVKKMETKEASRTYGNGSKEGRGLRKARLNNRNYEYNPFKLSESHSNNEVQLLREKNEEYKKALDVFRTKLNEVAVFNSNLAYATRLFTEHSTTKQEKINILRRFDNVESLKESKNLYRSIKNELSSNGSVGEQKINESIDRAVNRTVETGSAFNLIESKTYENPQFLRMKDLMTKLK